jgi:phage terminase large subunit GpA-like protein
MVYQGCDMAYAEQVTSEHKVNVRSGGRTIQKWDLKSSHADNHYLDCEVYAMCAADMQGARSFHLETVEMDPRREIQEQQTPATPSEDSWLGTNGQSWL